MNIEKMQKNQEKLDLQTKKNIGYKLFKVKKSRPGEVFPLYVNADKPTPIGEWVSAECGEKKENGKVKSKLGDLCFRPGWHLSDYPLATHIGVKDEYGNVKYIKPDTVWCEVEYSDNINYQEQANKNGLNKNNIVIPKNAYLKDIPTDGFYRYKTNPNMFQDWIIAGAIKINRIISDSEVNQILKQNGILTMERFGGEFDYAAYGF